MLKSLFRKIGCIMLIIAMFVQPLSAQVIQFSENRLVDASTQSKQGYALVEFKTIGQMMDLDVVYNPSNKSIKISDIGNSLILYLGKTNGLFNGKKFAIGAAPISAEGRIYIPLRVVAEKFGYQMTSNKERIILSRSFSEEEKELLKKWEWDLSNHYGILFNINSDEIKDLPIEERKKSISPQIKSIKSVLNNPTTSPLIKVIAQECICTLQAIEQLYTVDRKNKQEFENRYETAMYKIKYLYCEYEDIKNERYPKLPVPQEFSIPSYDEVRVSMGYNHFYHATHEIFKQVQQEYLEDRVYMAEISYKTSTIVNFREGLKYMRRIIRSQDAKETIDTYIAYTDLIIAYFCDIRRNLDHPEILTKRYNTALLKGEQSVEEAYNKYLSFDKTINK